jgi:hypothetical protein
LVGCRLPPDREPLKPLPENEARYSYGELLSRLQAQGGAALDAFFVDAWIELDEAAAGIDQTARFLAKTTDAPEHLKTTLPQKCGNLQKEAARLAEAAQKKSADSATEALQRITLQIRQLKAKNEP